MAIASISETMDLYNNAVDQAIPWAKLKEINRKLGQSGSESFSKQSANRIGNIKTQLLYAIDAYDSATQSVYEMCGVVSPVLSRYVQLFDSPNPAKLAVQKNLLTSLLENVLKQLTKAQDELTNTVSALKRASEEFKALLDQLKIDYNENDNYFKKRVSQIVRQKSGFWSFFRKKQIEQEAIAELRAKLTPIQAFYKGASEIVRQAQITLGQTTSKLNKNIQTIGQQKTQVSASNAEDASRIHDTIIQSAQALIAKCQEYHQRHA